MQSLKTSALHFFPETTRYILCHFPPTGTYNNQYMVVDLKKIKLRENIADGALWVVEQIPTLVEAGDQTAILRAGNSSGGRYIRSPRLLKYLIRSELMHCCSIAGYRILFCQLVRSLWYFRLLILSSSRK